MNTNWQPSLAFAVFAMFTIGCGQSPTVQQIIRKKTSIPVPSIIPICKGNIENNQTCKPQFGNWQSTRRFEYLAEVDFNDGLKAILTNYLNDQNRAANEKKITSEIVRKYFLKSYYNTGTFQKIYSPEDDFEMVDVHKQQKEVDRIIKKSLYTSKMFATSFIALQKQNLSKQALASFKAAIGTVSFNAIKAELKSVFKNKIKGFEMRSGQILHVSVTYDMTEAESWSGQVTGVSGLLIVSGDSKSKVDQEEIISDLIKVVVDTKIVTLTQKQKYKIEAEFDERTKTDLQWLDLQIQDNVFIPLWVRLGK